jgi:hypothetical protein
MRAIFSAPFILSLRPIHAPVQWVRGFFLGVKAARKGVVLTTHPELVLRLKKK